MQAERSRPIRARPAQTSYLGEVLGVFVSGSGPRQHLDLPPIVSTSFLQFPPVETVSAFTTLYLDPLKSSKKCGCLVF
jgi:hypothetical protein